MSNNKDIKVANPDEFREPKYSNTFRLGFTETEFVVDFGVMSPDQEEVTIVSKVSFPIEKIKQFILGLFVIGQKYQEAYNKNIGFPPMNKDDESDDEIKE